MAEGKLARKTGDDIAFDNFFIRFHLSDLKDAFVENGFRTCRSLMIVTDDDLKEIGITSLGLRKEVLGAVEEWKKPLTQSHTRFSESAFNKPPPALTFGSPPPPPLSYHPHKPVHIPASSPGQPNVHIVQSPSAPSMVAVSSPVTTSGGPGIPQLHQPALVRPRVQDLPGASPPDDNRFHRIKRNENCPYPECTWAGLSAHFHCLVCSEFHTNKSDRIRSHLRRHEEGESGHELDEYRKVKQENYIIFGNNCPEHCKYSEQGVRHLHCKHCEWKTKKFDSRLLAHFKSHHEKQLRLIALQHYETEVSGRTVSPLPTMAMHEAQQIAAARANHHEQHEGRPPKMVKLEPEDQEEHPAVSHLQQSGGLLNCPTERINQSEEGRETEALGSPSKPPEGKHAKCMVCGDTQTLRSALMREQKGRNGPVDWNKTKQLFSYHHIKTTIPHAHWICGRHMEEFNYFQRAYLSLWKTCYSHPQVPPLTVASPSPPRESEEGANATAQELPAVYLMNIEQFNEHLNHENEEQEEEEEAD